MMRNGTSWAASTADLPVSAINNARFRRVLVKPHRVPRKHFGPFGCSAGLPFPLRLAEASSDVRHVSGVGPPHDPGVLAGRRVENLA
jgi:hypothetical protein